MRKQGEILAWTIRISKRALKSLRKMDKQVSNRILNELDRVAELDNPRKRGKALTGQLSGLWCYRIGNYRAICMIANNELVILVIDVDHRSTIYSKNY